MKKQFVVLMVLALFVLGFNLYGCGAAGTSVLSTGTTAVSILGKASGLSGRVELPDVLSLAGVKGAGDWQDTSYGHGNPWYFDRLQVPLSFVVGISELKFLTQNNYNDASAYTVNLGGTYSVNNPKIVDLASSSNPLADQAAPSAGTYTHMGMTLVFVQQTLSGAFTSNPNFIESRNIRLYASTSGKIQAGDVLMEANGTWNWIKTADGSYVPISQDRPGGTASGWNTPTDGFGNPTGSSVEVASVVQDTWWSLRLANNLTNWQQTEVAAMAANNYVFKGQLAFASSFTIVTGHNYTMTMTFDVSVSPDQYVANVPTANGTGTFFWDDVTNDGVFKPAVSFADGGDQNNGNGQPDWNMLPPTITLTVTEL